MREKTKPQANGMSEPKTKPKTKPGRERETNLKAEGFSVGYGRPPKHSQFKPGQSGNPKGRRKGARSFAAILDEELEQQILVTENGRTSKVTKYRIIAKAQIAKAAKGDSKACALILAHSARLRSIEVLQDGDLELIDKQMIAEYRRRVLGKTDDDDAE